MMATAPSLLSAHHSRPLTAQRPRFSRQCWARHHHVDGQIKSDLPELMAFCRPGGYLWLRVVVVVLPCVDQYSVMQASVGSNQCQCAPSPPGQKPSYQRRREPLDLLLCWTVDSRWVNPYYHLYQI